MVEIMNLEYYHDTEEKNGYDRNDDHPCNSSDYRRYAPDPPRTDHRRRDNWCLNVEPGELTFWS